MLKCGMHFAYNYLYVQSEWFHIQVVYTIFMMYTFCKSELMYTKCTPHLDKLLYTFCMQNVAAIVLFIFYIKCIKKFVGMWYTFCKHLAQFFYTKCIRSFHIGKWDCKRCSIWNCYWNRTALVPHIDTDVNDAKIFNTPPCRYQNRLAKYQERNVFGIKKMLEKVEGKKKKKS